jgi:hypothetical protein
VDKSPSCLARRAQFGASGTPRPVHTVAVPQCPPMRSGLEEVSFDVKSPCAEPCSFAPSTPSNVRTWTSERPQTRLPRAPAQPDRLRGIRSWERAPRRHFLPSSSASFPSAVVGLGGSPLRARRWACAELSRLSPLQKQAAWGRGRGVARDGVDTSKRSCARDVSGPGPLRGRRRRRRRATRLGLGDSVLNLDMVVHASVDSAKHLRQSA